MSKKLFLLPLLLLCLLLSGCDKNFLTDKQRLEGVNQAGAEYGMVFRKADVVPDMPDGAVLIFDADRKKEVITEVYLEDVSPIVRAIYGKVDGSVLEYEHVLIFVCEQERVIVAFRQFYGLKEDYIISSILQSIGELQGMKDIILYVQKKSTWTEQDNEYLYENFPVYPREGRPIGDFIFEETRNPDSPYSLVTKDTPDEAIREMLQNSLRESYELTHPLGCPDASVGDKAHYTALPDGVWRIYGLYKASYLAKAKSYIPAVIKEIREDILFLMNS